MQLSNLYKKKVLVLQKNTTAFEAARAMSEKFVGCALVSDGKGHIIGILTDRDLACGVLGEGLSENTPVTEIMAPDVKFVFEDAKLSQVIQIMKKYGLRRVPVVRVGESGAQHCVGIYSLDDLIACGEVPASELKPIVRKQMRQQLKKYTKSDRNEAHKEQTLNKFNKTIALEMALERELAEELSFALLKVVVQILPGRVAAKFIAELPSMIQEDFLNIKSGPDPRITLEVVMKKLMTKYKFGEGRFRKLMASFWTGLEIATKNGSAERIFRKIPLEFQAVFKPIEKPSTLLSYDVDAFI